MKTARLPGQDKGYGMSTIGILARVCIVTIGISASSFAAHAQDSAADEKLKTLNAEIVELGETLQERAAAYPGIIEDIRRKRADLDRAETDVQQMIDDLKQLTDKMDADSEFHVELQGLEQQTSQLLAETKSAGDKLSQELVGQVQARLDLIKNLDRRRADAIIEARSAIRTLEDNKERLVLIRKIGAIDAALTIMEASVADFEDIVAKANAVSADVSTAVAAQ